MKRFGVLLAVTLGCILALTTPGRVLALAGGPDGYGYTYLDSVEPGGPDVMFEDISGVGTQVFFSSDYEEVDLPFAFPFYGGAYTQAYLYGDCAWCWGYQTHIAFGAPDYWSYGSVWWMDQIDRDSGAIYVYSDTLSSPQRFIVQYDGVYNYNYGTTTTSQVILYEDGNILVRYDGDFSWWPSWWSGQPQLYSPMYGSFQYASYPQNNLAVQFYPPRDYDVRLSPPATSNGGQPGAFAWHWLTLMNTGLNEDTYDLSVGGNAWMTELLDPMSYTPIAQVSNVPSHGTVDFIVRVTVPASIVTPGAFDVVTVTATSVASPSISSDAVVTTYGPGTPAIINVTADPNSVVPLATSAVTAIVMDAYGVPVFDGTVITQYRKSHPVEVLPSENQS